MNMKELKERAVKVEDHMCVYWPQFNSHGVIDLKALKPEEKKMQFSCINSVVAFVSEDGQMYVIPDIVIQNLLNDEGYSRSFFYVPFSDWDYPVAYEKKWKEFWNFTHKK